MRGQLTCIVSRIQGCRGKLEAYLKKLFQLKISRRNGTDCNDRFAQYHHQVLQFIFKNLRLDAAGYTAKDYSKAERAKHDEKSCSHCCAQICDMLLPYSILKETGPHKAYISICTSCLYNARCSQFNTNSSYLNTRVSARTGVPQPFAIQGTALVRTSSSFMFQCHGTSNKTYQLFFKPVQAARCQLTA